MRLCYRRQALGALGTAPIAPHELMGDGLHGLGAQRAVVAQQVAQLEGQRDDPVADGRLGQHRVHQVSGGVRARAQLPSRPGPPLSNRSGDHHHV